MLKFILKALILAYAIEVAKVKSKADKAKRKAHKLYVEGAEGVRDAKRLVEEAHQRELEASKAFDEGKVYTDERRALEKQAESIQARGAEVVAFIKGGSNV